MWYNKNRVNIAPKLEMEQIAAGRFVEYRSGGIRMSQEPKKRPAAKGNGNQNTRQARPSGNRRPQPRRPRGSGTKTAVEIVVSLALVALVGYEGFHMYKSLTPISQGADGMVIGNVEESETEESAAEQTVYENIAVENSQVHAGDLILVNGENAYEENNATEIVSIYEHKTDNYHVSGTETSLREPAIEALNQMLDDFFVATGHNDIIIISGYRTNAQQQELYDADLEATGAETSSRVAKPGYSEHETGYSLDVSLYQDGVQYDYDGTGEYEWINQNCGHYGYILRYAEDKTETTGYQAEPWHYRYVGQPHAAYMAENNLCLEEYLTLLKNYDTDNHLSITNWDGEIYEVYYVPADAAADSTYILVPPDQEYTISGNNRDGFIVTVDTGEIQAFGSDTTTPEDGTGETTDITAGNADAAVPEDNEEITG